MTRLYATPAAGLSVPWKRESLADYILNPNSILARRVIGGGFIAGLVVLGLAFSVII
jgi:hypothetical protein